MLAPLPVADALDRLAILAIKRTRVVDPAARSAVEREDAALRQAWSASQAEAPEAIEGFAALTEVNEALWEVEDRLREHEARGTFDAAFVERARSVYRLNDRRAALKRELNQRLGSALVEVKQHPEYARGSDLAAAGAELTHVDSQGNARMVEVGQKPVTRREATAEARVRMSEVARQAILERSAAKGDVLGVAQLAGIQAAKKTAELIPLCHPLPLDAVEVRLGVVDDGVRITATVRCTARTGVEMEALTAASVAGLAVIDMVKALDRGMVIEGVRLLAKSGGRSGSYVAPEGRP
jgi:cyclic pyranopterin phosphate synthase